MATSPQRPNKSPGGRAAGAEVGLKSRLRARLRGWGGRPERFCLITGSPRSGTTALHEWLHNNPAVAAATESRILFAAHAFVEQMERFKRLHRYADSITPRLRNLVLDHYNQTDMAGKSIVIDKEPMEPIALPGRQYGAFLQSVRMLFPGCKFIFMVRDPYATTWSMAQRTWGHSLTHGEPRTFTLDEHATNWAECADLALKYADDPESYICSFERLVSEPEAESRRVCSFLGVPIAAPFQPAPVKQVNFSEQERARIDELTHAQVQALQHRRLWIPAASGAAAVAASV